MVKPKPPSITVALRTLSVPVPPTGVPRMTLTVAFSVAPSVTLTTPVPVLPTVSAPVVNCDPVPVTVRFVDPPATSPMETLRLDVSVAPF